MKTIINTQALVIGGGPAGYTAALYLGRSGRQPVVVTGPEPGGQLTLTTDVENFPGFSKPVQGPWLMDEMALQATSCGAILKEDTIQEVNFSSRPFKCMGSKATYLADTVIIATGASTKWLGRQDETFFRGHGVSSCATCDGPLFKGKDIVVVGGGNSAAEEALYLTQHARKVYLVHRRDRLRADKVLVDRLQSNPKIEGCFPYEIEGIQGTESPKVVKKILIRQVNSGLIRSIDASGLFVAIGHIPNTAIFKPYLEVDIHGYLIGKPDSSSTSIPGIFVAGDVKDKIYRQAITAAGQGCMASLDAERFLQYIT